MVDRHLVSSGSPYEKTFGFSRAVRLPAATSAGDRVLVSGTVAWGDDGKLAAPGDMYGQAKQVLRNIEKALAEGGRVAGRRRAHVHVRHRHLALRRGGRAHGEAFGDVRPAATLVAVSALVEPEMLVEIEAEAVVAR